MVTRRRPRDVVLAGLAGAALSGAPSTLHALATGRDPLAATLAAGALLAGERSRPAVRLAAAVPVHLALSLGWAALLARVLPKRRTVAWGAAAGLAIAVLDLGLVGRRHRSIRALPLAPQVADHVLFGAIVGATLARTDACPAARRGTSLPWNPGTSPR